MSFCIMTTGHTLSSSLDSLPVSGSSGQGPCPWPGLSASPAQLWAARWYFSQGGPDRTTEQHYLLKNQLEVGKEEAGKADTVLRLL